LVSTTDTNTTSFTKLNTNLIVTNPVVEWVEYTFDLDTYKGQEVYIAIQCVSDGQFALQVDDFKVTATEILAVNDINKSSLSVYPNPTSDFLTISGSKLESVEIYDATGKRIKSGIVEADNRLDVRNLSAGQYILKVKSENATTSHKFIKK